MNIYIVCFWPLFLMIFFPLAECRLQNDTPTTTASIGCFSSWIIRSLQHFLVVMLLLSSSPSSKQTANSCRSTNMLHIWGIVQGCGETADGSTDETHNKCGIWIDLSNLSRKLEREICSGKIVHEPHTNSYQQHIRTYYPTLSLEHTQCTRTKTLDGSRDGTWSFSRTNAAMLYAAVIEICRVDMVRTALLCGVACHCALPNLRLNLYLYSRKSKCAVLHIKLNYPPIAIKFFHWFHAFIVECLCLCVYHMR